MASIDVLKRFAELYDLVTEMDAAKQIQENTTKAERMNIALGLLRCEIEVCKVDKQLQFPLLSIPPIPSGFKLYSLTVTSPTE